MNVVFEIVNAGALNVPVVLTNIFEFGPPEYDTAFQSK